MDYLCIGFCGYLQKNEESRTETDESVANARHTDSAR